MMRVFVVLSILICIGVSNCGTSALVLGHHLFRNNLVHRQQLLPHELYPATLYGSSSAEIHEVDYIDVEIVSSLPKKVHTDERSADIDSTNQKESPTISFLRTPWNIINSMKNLIQRSINSISATFQALPSAYQPSMLGQTPPLNKEKPVKIFSRQRLEQQRQREKTEIYISNEIDKVFSSSGYLGSVAGSFLKTLSSSVMNNVNGWHDDVALIQDAVQQRIAASLECSIYFRGSQVRSLSPTSMSVSTTVLQGHLIKEISLLYPIETEQSDQIVGSVDVAAILPSDENSDVEVKRLCITSNDGRQFDLTQVPIVKSLQGFIIDAEAV